MFEGTLYTIGFTKKTAEEFFTLLQKAQVRRLIDVRLNNESQLAAFTKKKDLRYFLETICDCEYEHRPDWAPTKDILDGYKKKKMDWDTYCSQFKELLGKRQIEKDASLEYLSDAVLLCSEPTADKCHRRLVAEYLRKKFDDLRIFHL